MFKKTGAEMPVSMTLHRRSTHSGGAGSAMVWLDPAGRDPAQAGASGRSAELVIEGSVRGDTDLVVNGRIKGDVDVTSLTLDEGGVIEGSIVAEQVEIRGRVTGEIRATVVHLCAKAVVEGDITAGKISIELGAEFQGMCRRMPAPPAPAETAVATEPEPLPAQAATKAAAAFPSPPPEPAEAFDLPAMPPPTASRPIPEGARA